MKTQLILLTILALTFAKTDVDINVKSFLSQPDDIVNDVPAPQGRALEAIASNECSSAVSFYKVLKTVCTTTKPFTFKMELLLNNNLEICDKENDGKGVLEHRVYFLSSDNRKTTPNWNPKENPKDNYKPRYLGDPEYAIPIPVFNLATTNKDPNQAMAWYSAGAYKGQDDPDSPYSFDYSFNNNRIEQLQSSKFYEESDEVVDPADKTGNAKFTEVRVFLMHTIWLKIKPNPQGTKEEDKNPAAQLSRWMEWSISVKIYKVLPFGLKEPATVVPVIVDVPPCAGGCVLSVKHTGVLMFIEERKLGADGKVLTPLVPQYLDDKDINWNKQRVGLQFQSLSKGVCFKITLKDKTSKRKFVLDRLQYQYNFNDFRDLYNPNAKPLPVKSESLTDFEWVQTYKDPVTEEEAGKFIRFKLKFLKLGAVQQLTYMATIRLCKLTDSANPAQNSDKNTCDPVTVADATDAEIDAKTKKLATGRRMLANGRLMSTQGVAQQYTSEGTTSCGATGDCMAKEGGYTPTTVEGESTSGGGGGAIIAVVGVLVVLGGVGGAAFFLSKKKPEVPSGGNQQQPNANMQGAQE